MTLLFQFEKRPQFYELFFIASYLLINNTINATSILMEASRYGQTLSFPLWQPFLWEYSSALSLIILLPLLTMFLNKAPLNWQFIKKNFIWHIIASIAFSMTHIALMVFFRKMAYVSQNLQYEFGDLPNELFYEYRKDAWAYIIFIIIIYCYRFVISRMIGEARPISDGEDSTKLEHIERLLIKKLGKEFIVKIKDIEWLESNGNYVNLYIKNRIYPTRSTMGNFIEQFSEQGFCRIHRSHGVNLDAVDSITSLPSGDGEVKLKNGKVLNLSRRYRNEFKMKLN
jgi:LytTr DNA-binding domain-containing protein